MVQSILLGIIFVAAIAYLGRFIYKQLTVSKNEGSCDKCLSKDSLKKGV
ncbi:MAG: hypothetical protein MI975_11575 [Cytophagales bacterium]|nr:hypothetical protein [Cytophagales bacterium]